MPPKHRTTRPDPDPGPRTAGDGERFTLTLRALPDPLGRDATYRLKVALKLLRRACAFQCVGIRRDTFNQTGDTP